MGDRELEVKQDENVDVDVDVVEAEAPVANEEVETSAEASAEAFVAESEEVADNYLAYQQAHGSFSGHDAANFERVFVKLICKEAPSHIVADLISQAKAAVRGGRAV